MSFDFNTEFIRPLKEVDLQSQIVSRQKDRGCQIEARILKHPSQNHLYNDFDLPSKGDFLSFHFKIY